MPVPVKWVRDGTGRFSERPHYDPAALDQECEAVVRNFLTDKYGRSRYPISTDDLTVLIEQHAADLDQFADLAAAIEGRTTFHPPHQPDVAINRRLQDERYLNRLRTTLAHELGHVLLHSFVWTFAAPRDDRSFVCNREQVIGAATGDWMEWQAGYASGAYLVPRTALARLIGEPDGSWPSQDSDAGLKMIAEVQQEFEVSEAAARVRLSQLRYVLPDT